MTPRIAPGHTADPLGYLRDGGEVGRCLLAHQDGRSPMGAPSHWPTALHDVLRVTLHSDFPYIVYWGDALHTFWNDAARHFFEGQHPHDLGRPLAQVQPDVMGTLSPLLQQVQQTGRAVRCDHMQLLYQRKDYREEIHEIFSYSPLLDEAGQVRGIICPIFDTTARVLYERRIAALSDLATRTRSARTEAQYLQLLAECLARHPPDLPLAALYMAEDDGIPTHAMARLCAAAPSHAPWPAQWQPAVRAGEFRVFAAEDALPLALRSVVSTAPNQLAWVPIPGPRSERRTAWLVVALNPYKRLDTDYQTFLELVAAQIGQGLTDTLALEQAAALAQAELAQFTRLSTLGELATSIAHEVNQPLTAMVLDAHACLRWMSGPHANLTEARAAAQRVARSGEHAGQVVARIRRFLQREPALRQVLQLEQVAWDSVQLVAGRAQRHHAQLRVRLYPDLPHIEADRTQVQQMIINLLVNAIDAVSTLPPEQARHIWLTLRRCQTPVVGVEFCIIDNGPGVAAEQLAHLFDPFHTSKPDGLGFGLSIVRSLVEAHEGRIWIENQAHGGTLARFQLPGLAS